MTGREEVGTGAPREACALWGVLCGLLLGLLAMAGLSWLAPLPGVALFAVATVVIGGLAVWVLPSVAVRIADRMDGGQR